MNAASTPPSTVVRKSMFGLTVGALGIVYGDIGISPLYAFREALAALAVDGVVARADVLGVLSLILWSLMLVVTVKYVAVLLRFDNRGEGGALSLMALARSGFYSGTVGFLFLGIASTALFFGDAAVMPALSVLSAVEGLKIVSPSLSIYILPVSITIIFALFSMQARGTTKISALFGPIMTVWFALLAVTGLQHINAMPDVLHALNPLHALVFLFHHGSAALVVLGAVFLAVTGVEALYADLGHFGRKPIQIAWIWLVFPALALNYLGQGALVLSNPAAIDNPFFRMVGADQLLPLVVLATVAAVIASQAVLTGAFSLTRQAINLGLMPRLAARYPSDTHSDRIFFPQVNYLLLIGVLFFAIVFGSSSALAWVYGISISGAMIVTTIIAFFVLWKIREWPIAVVLFVALPVLLIDYRVLFSNMLKIVHGGWIPLLIACALMLCMGVWVRGTMILTSRQRKRNIKLEDFIASLPQKYGDVPRVPGTAFFLSSDPHMTPVSLIQNLRHNRVLHDRNVILSIRIEPIPYVEPEHRSIITTLNRDFSMLVMRFGFKEAPDVQSELVRLNRDPAASLHFDWRTTSLFLTRRALRAHPRYGLPIWQDLIFIWMNRNATAPSDYYRLPIRRVIEIGQHVMI